MSNKQVKVIHDLDEEGILGVDESEVIREFKTLKTDSISQGGEDYFAAPSEGGTQATDKSPHPLFGRDRIFDHPSYLSTRIINANLAHIHIDTDGVWGYPHQEPQWGMTSKNALIYSAFETKGEYVFVVHEILCGFPDSDEKGAHKFYKSADVEGWLEQADWHRGNYPSPCQRIFEEKESDEE